MINNLETEKTDIRKFKIQKEPILTGELTGYASIDRPWLKYYSKDAIEAKIPATTIYDELKKISNTCPNDVAIEYFGKKITYKNLISQIDQTANAFLEKGVKKGDFITIAIPNIPENVFCLYALNKIGAIANFVDLTSKGDDLVNYINEVQTSLLIASDVFLDNVVDVLERTTIKDVVIVSPSDSLPSFLKLMYNLKQKISIPNNKKYETWKNFQIRGKNSLLYSSNLYEKDSTAVMLHTSGTTGLPKGVMLTNENMNAMVFQYKYVGLDFEEHDRYLNQVPPFLAYNIVMATHLPLILKMRIIMLPDYQPSKFAENLIKYNINHAIAGPADWDNLRTNSFKLKDLSKLKTMASGSDKMDSKHKQEVDNIVKLHGSNSKIIEGYGQTEGGCADTTNLPQCNIPGSVGIPLPKMCICIYDNENENEMKYNEEGEICISGPTVMKSYYNNDEETEKVLRFHSDGNLWLHSGDLGYINEDGVLFVSGRLKRIIVRNDGIKISPFKIEQIIKKNINVEDCCVVGIPDLENQMGEVAIANIVIKQESLFNSEQILKDIIKMCNEELGEKYLPKDYLVIDKLPLTNVGKVNFRKLSKMNEDCIQKQKTLKK